NAGQAAAGYRLLMAFISRDSRRGSGVTPPVTRRCSAVCQRTWQTAIFKPADVNDCHGAGNSESVISRKGGRLPTGECSALGLRALVRARKLQDEIRGLLSLFPAPAGRADLCKPKWSLMAKIVLGVWTTHGPQLNTTPEQWMLRLPADRSRRHAY